MILSFIFYHACFNKIIRFQLKAKIPSHLTLRDVILQTKIMMGDVMKEASFSLAEAKFATGHFSHLVLQNVNKAQIKVRSKNDNVAGMFHV